MERVLVEEQPEQIDGELAGIPTEWRNAPRRWGHPLHSLCSYFAMFPPQVPRVFIEWLSNTGDIVYDPFSGRGTAPLEACRLGRIGLGSDANPLAFVLTGAKVNPPTIEEIGTRLEHLKKEMPLRKKWEVTPEIEMLYSPKVLRQLCWVRTQLKLESRIDRFIMATVLGMMHANYKVGSPARGLSISMPNTFSMSPAYVKGYIAAHDLRPPEVDLFEMLHRKIARMSLPDAAAGRGRAWAADARIGGEVSEGRANLVFTSPPYLGVIKYGKYNWIRLWMLGHNPREVDHDLVATTSLRRYLEFMSDVLARLLRAVDPAGFVCLMIGDVHEKSSGATLNLAETVWRNTAETAGWRKLGIVHDHIPEQHKVSRIWGNEKKGNATKVDRILILAPPGSEHALPPFPRPFRWTTPNTWAPSLTEEK